MIYTRGTMIKINNIKATGMDLTPAIKEYVAKKVDMLEKFVDSADTSVAVDVEVGKTTAHHQGGDVFRTEINFYIGGKQFRAESTKDDLYASIDEVKDELSRVLKEHKDKELTERRKGGAFLKRLLKGFRRNYYE